MGEIAQEAEAPDQDAELHAALIAGEEDAVAEFEQRYRRQFIAHGKAKGMSLEDSEDAWQDVFFASAREAHRLTPLGEGLRKYAWGMMRNLVADHYEKQSSAHESLDEEQVSREAIRHQRVAPTMVDNSIRQAVRRCLEGLSAAPRALLEALFTEGLPPDVLAERLGIPRNTVYKRKTRALTQIRPCLEEALCAS